MPNAAKSRGRRKKNERRSDCPMAAALDVIGDKWTLLVVRDLQQGCKRYGDFLESPEQYPTNILADRLKRLEAHGFIERTLYSKRPPRAEYHLTAKGYSLKEVMDTLSDWGMRTFDGCVPYERAVTEPAVEEPATVAEAVTPEETAPEPVETIIQSEPEPAPEPEPEPEVVFEQAPEPEPIVVEQEPEPAPRSFEPVVFDAPEPETEPEPALEEVAAEITPDPVEADEEETPAARPFEPVVISSAPEPVDAIETTGEEESDDPQEQMSLWG